MKTFSKLALSVLLLLSLVLSHTAAMAAWQPTGGAGGEITAFAIDPAHPDTIFAAASGGVYKSVDGGASWAPSGNGISYASGLETSSSVDALAIDPSNTQVIYAGATFVGGIFKSTDAGATWTAVNTGLPAEVGISTIAIDPANSQVIYAGNSSGESGASVFKSTDGGATWTTVLTGKDVYSLAIDKTNTQVVYAGITGGILKSTDGGATWPALTTGLIGLARASSIVIDPTDSKIVYAATDNGILKTTNLGTVWTLINSDSWFNVIGIDPMNTNTIYAGATGIGMFRSGNGGASWSAIDTGLTSTKLLSLAVNPAVGQTVYLGTGFSGSGGGVYKTVNAGDTWSISNAGLSSIEVGGLSIDSAGTVYVAGWERGLLKSSNGGGTWEILKNGLVDEGDTPFPVEYVAVDPVNNRNVYAFLLGSGVYKSIDAGQNWSQASNALSDVTSVAFDRTNSQIIYAATFNGIFKSTDGGVSWAAINSGLRAVDVSSIVIDPSNTLTLYAGLSDGGVFKTTNGGTFWSAAESGLVDGYGAVPQILSLAIDPATSQTLYAGTSYSGVFKSTDGGLSWNPITTGLIPDGSGSFYPVQALAVDASNHAVWAGTTAGVYSSANGELWVARSAGLGSTNRITALAVDPVNHLAYAGTEANGVYRTSTAGSPFPDVPADSIYASYIEAIANRGITVGCGGGNYCPSLYVTRGQMAAFIVRSLHGEDFTYTATPYFSDVPPTNVYFKYVQRLKDENITALSGTYYVDLNVTRGQMAAFLVRAKFGESFFYTQTPYFTDVPTGNEFFKYVQRLKDSNITALTGTYFVDTFVSREQMAAFISRAFLGMQ